VCHQSEVTKEQNPVFVKKIFLGGGNNGLKVAVFK